MSEPKQPTFSRWMGSMWLYSVLRFGLFFALWGLMVLVGLGGLVAAFVGLVLSIPLGLVLLARPRAAVAGNIESRVNARRQANEDLSARLDPDPEPED
jgi:O-antigen ligase